MKESDGTYENVSLVCYCSADQCNAFWAQVVEGIEIQKIKYHLTIKKNGNDHHKKKQQMYINAHDTKENITVCYKQLAYLENDKLCSFAMYL